jgi:hypothetical protein
MIVSTPSDSPHIGSFLEHVNSKYPLRVPMIFREPNLNMFIIRIQAFGTTNDKCDVRVRLSLLFIIGGA